MNHLVWNIDPEIFQIGNFGPRYYGLLFALGFILSYQFLQWVFKREGFDPEKVSSLIFHCMIGTIVGARLGHCLFYEPEYYLSHPHEILFVWKGGLASHGGTLGVILAVWLFQRKNREIGYMWLADRGVPAIALTAAFIRIGNFFNSEIIGRPSEVPWAVVFQRVDNVPRHPAMLYEALAYLGLFSVSFFIYRRDGKNLRPGLLIGMLFAWIFGARFVLEFYKENQVAFESDMMLNMGQLLSIPFVVVGILLMTGTWKKLLATGR